MSLLDLLKQKKYCTTWASSQYLTETFNMSEVPLSNNSLRQVIHASIGGSVIKIKLSNRCGDQPLQIREVHIAYSKEQGSGAIIPETDKVVTFKGKKEIIIPEGKEAYSDDITFEIEPMCELAVTIFFGNVPMKVTGHPGSRTNFYIEKGNALKEETFTHRKKAAHWYVLAAVEVLTENNKKAIVCFGDSITDGRGSTDDKQNRWTDIFLTRLYENKRTAGFAVINQGIGGTCVQGCGQERYDRDVLSLPGAKAVIVLYGINDIMYLNSDSDTIISIYKDLIAKAHKKGLKIFGGTLLPFGDNCEWNEKREEVRLAVNKWILENAGSPKGFDAAIDFAQAMKAGNEEKLRESNENDGLHPTVKGYEDMANAIPLSLFEEL